MPIVNFDSSIQDVDPKAEFICNRDIHAGEVIRDKDIIYPGKIIEELSNQPTQSTESIMKFSFYTEKINQSIREITTGFNHLNEVIIDKTKEEVNELKEENRKLRLEITNIQRDYSNIHKERAKLVNSERILVGQIIHLRANIEHLDNTIVDLIS